MLSTRQAAAILKVSDRMVRYYISRGWLHATRLGRRSWVITPADANLMKLRQGAFRQGRKHP